jgi:hypothetical protein
MVNKVTAKMAMAMNRHLDEVGISPPERRRKNRDRPAVTPELDRLSVGIPTRLEDRECQSQKR